VAVLTRRSLELRVPFLDHELAEYVFALPGNFKLQNQQGKLVLREAVKDLLPLATIVRDKTGFDMPMSVWMAGPLRQIVEETLALPEAYE